MKLVKIMSLNLIVAVLTLSLSGCYDWMTSNHDIHFVATSDIPTTKAEYGDIVDGGKWQRIDWKQGDMLTIVSDIANTKYDNSGNYYCDYKVISVREPKDEEKSSYAHIQAVTPDGLKWDEEDDKRTYQFWAVYPNTVPISKMGDDIGTITVDANTRYPLVAYAKTNYSQTKDNNDVLLSFYPAFTALQFDIVCPVSGVQIENCVISSSNAIKGTFTARIGSQGIDKETYLVQSKTEQYEVDADIKEEIVNGKSFLFFCLPEDLEDITVTCYFKVSGKDDVQHKQIRITEYVEGKKFTACKKHVINLVLDSSIDDDDFELGLGALQMFLDIIRDNGSQNFGGQNGIYKLLKDYYDSHSSCGITSGDDFNKKIWNTTFKDLWDKFDHLTMQDIIDVFGKDVVDILLEAVRNLHRIWLTDADITGSVSAKDLQKMIPEVRELYVQYPGVDSISFEIDGLQYLTKLTLQHPKGHISVKNCPELTEMSMTNADKYATYEFENLGLTSFSGEKGTHYSFKDCPDLTSVTINNAENNFIGADFDSCGLTSFWFGSANAPDAVFKFKNMSELTSIYVEKAREVIASNCSKLITVKYSTNYGTKPTVSVDRATCPNYKGENYN